MINAPAENVFRYISNFKNGQRWNPYAQKDPKMKTTFTGNDGQVGSVMEFEGNREAGSGTRFSWAMSGDGGYLGKLVSVFINCERMVSGDFEKGIAQLKAVVEAELKTSK